MFAGAIASDLPWGLYGPLASYQIYPIARVASADLPGLTLASLVGAALIGIGGARWLHSEVDEVMLKTAAVVAAKTGPSQEVAEQLSRASPEEAYKITQAIENASESGHSIVVR